MAIEALEGVTDEDLFNEANADEPAAEVVEEVAAAEAEQVEEPVAEIVAEKPEAVVEKPAVDDNAPMIPSFRLKEEADARRRAETDLANERADKAALRQRLEALEKPAAKVEEPKAVKPDPLLDPEGYEAYLEQRFEARQLNTTREFDLRMTRQTNVELFDKAYGESQRLKQANDPAFMELSQKMHSTSAPGKVLLDWYQQRQVQAEVGNDPNAFFQKRLDAWLADPANQATVIERARGGAQAQLQPGTGGKPAPVVSLPPSLTRTASATSNDTDDNDISDDGLWRSANA